jgi:hypothetical protein
LLPTVTVGIGNGMPSKTLPLHYQPYAYKDERQEQKQQPNPEAPPFWSCSVIPVILYEASLLKMPYSVCSGNSSLDNGYQEYSNTSQNR